MKNIKTNSYLFLLVTCVFIFELRYNPLIWICLLVKSPRIFWIKSWNEWKRQSARSALLKKLLMTKKTAKSWYWSFTERISKILSTLTARTKKSSLRSSREGASGRFWTSCIFKTLKSRKMPKKKKSSPTRSLLLWTTFWGLGRGMSCRDCAGPIMDPLQTRRSRRSRAGFFRTQSSLGRARAPRKRSASQSTRRPRNHGTRSPRQKKRQNLRSFRSATFAASTGAKRAFGSLWPARPSSESSTEAKPAAAWKLLPQWKGSWPASTFSCRPESGVPSRKTGKELTKSDVSSWSSASWTSIWRNTRHRTTAGTISLAGLKQDPLA